MMPPSAPPFFAPLVHDREESISMHIRRPQVKKCQRYDHVEKLNTLRNLNYEASHRLLTQRQTHNFEKQNSNDCERHPERP
jgi:hypothetical protein